MTANGCDERLNVERVANDLEDAPFVELRHFPPRGGRVCGPRKRFHGFCDARKPVRGSFRRPMTQP